MGLIYGCYSTSYDHYWWTNQCSFSTWGLLSGRKKNGTKRCIASYKLHRRNPLHTNPWTRFSTSNFGASIHIYDRIWIVAHSQSIRCQDKGVSIGAEQKKSLFGIDGKYMANTESIGLEQEKEGQPSSEKWLINAFCKY